MKPNTAASLLLCGVLLALLSRAQISQGLWRLAAIVALVVVGVGALTLMEYLFGWDLRIDQAVFREGITPYPGRMSPSIALSLVLAGTALFTGSLRKTLRWRWPMLSALGAAVGMVGATAVAAYLSEALLHFHFWNYTGIAFHTAVGFACLGSGLLALVRSEGGLTWSVDAAATKGILIGVASLLTVALVSNNFTYRLQEADQWVSHTEEVFEGN
jgi:hypothetical protein